MKQITGQSIGNGIAIGRILVYRDTAAAADSRKVGDTDSEYARFCKAGDEASEELGALAEAAECRVGRKNAEIFRVHQMLLQDPDFTETVRKGIIEGHYNAEYAVTEAGKKLAARFTAMKDNEYLQQRSTDMKDIADRVVKKLQHRENRTPVLTEPVIIMAEDLTPGETVQMDMSRVLAFVTGRGSVNSHTAILARSLGITAVVNTGIIPDEAMNGHSAIVDGAEGVVYIDPDEETSGRFEKMKKAYDDAGRKLDMMIGQPTVTKSGHRIGLFANAGSVSDVQKAAGQDAEGIGLFRSEFLYIGREDFPSEEMQFENYKKAAEIMGGREVVIRTFDIGADKKADYFGIGPEENPAMGMRAIRIALRRPDIFKTQLRAIYRASAFGGCISVMFPMITSVSEIDSINSMISEVKEELDSRKVAYGRVRQGIMIETPAAVMISDLLAEKVDFFSIGTNDLTQYTLAMDRQNAGLAGFMDTHHPAVLRMIEMTVGNAHRNNIKVGICGELGADPDLTGFFIKTGVDELSVPVPRLLDLRRHIRELE
jgi:phosphotransferase system enzyme I (PtsI)